MYYEHSCKIFCMYLIGKIFVRISTESSTHVENFRHLKVIQISDIEGNKFKVTIIFFTGTDSVWTEWWWTYDGIAGMNLPTYRSHKYQVYIKMYTK